MSDDVVIVAGGCLALAAPGIAGYALAVWRTRTAAGGWPAWLGWALATLLNVAFWGVVWGWSASLGADSGHDDGSASMARAVFLASIGVNTVVGVALAALRRGRA